MEEKNQEQLANTGMGIETLRDIRQMMEKSSRFISLSGLSGIAAGICALIGAVLASQKMNCWNLENCLFGQLAGPAGDQLEKDLYMIAGGTFFAALVLAFLFTALRSRKKNVPVWGPPARRLMWNVAVPILAAALFIYRMAELKQYQLVLPATLLFYGLALVNASKYTFNEIRYLGYLEILLGLICCWMPGYGLILWAIGFGALHIIYGLIMWWKYERQSGLDS